MREEGARGPDLETLLRDWAARNALPQARAEAIRRVVLRAEEMPVEALSVAWWHRLFLPLATKWQRSADLAYYLPKRGDIMPGQSAA